MTALSKKEMTHQRILQTAAKIIRRDGFDSLAVADVMKQAGLTHGGFYAHFSNRDALLAEALGFAGAEAAELIRQSLAHLISEGAKPLTAFIEIYLSEQHLNNCTEGAGCPVAALGSDFFRLDPTTKAVAGKLIEAYVEKVRELSNQTLSRESAFLLMSTMIGALQLARGLKGTAQASFYLTASREDLVRRYSDRQ
jgi:TetR/AcrR family transcriptional regulator, transcriptional repressor for nem operon